VDHADRAGLILACATIWSAAAAGQPQLSFDEQTQGVELRWSGTSLNNEHLDPETIGRWFSVYLGEAQTPMLGDYEIHGRMVRFQPRLAFLAGRDYRAEARHEDVMERPVILRFTPAVANPKIAARVLSVFPSGNVVPANLLRIYIVFSQPMMPEDVAKQIRLIDEDGEDVRHPFLEVKGGLWDPAATRLTLFLEPGRIKTGLALHESLGPVLKRGGSYRLTISKDMRDAYGEPLAADFTREYRVVAEDRASPDVFRWMLSHPRTGSSDELIINAAKPLDEPLFERLVRVETANGLGVPGQLKIGHGGATWRFTPAQPWKCGDYLIRVGAELEDLAGNRPTRLFEEIAASDKARARAQQVVRRFRIKRS
jgi:hypothetical protein